MELKQNTWALKELRDAYSIEHELDDKYAWLFINLDGPCVDYLCVRFLSGYGRDGSETEVAHVFSGHGVAGSLREMRHTYWGEVESDGGVDGYTYCLPRTAVIKALEILGEYFDED